MDLPDNFEVREKAFDLALIAFEANYPGVKIFENYDIIVGRTKYEHDGKKIFGGITPRTRSAGRDIRKGRGFFFPANFRDLRDIDATLRHEFLGHHGINTFVSADKCQLVNALLTTRDDAEFASIWARVDQNYADKNELQKAEEVFAFCCEYVEPSWRVDQKEAEQAFLACTTQRKITGIDVKAIITWVANGLQFPPFRPLQTFPKNENEQFKQAAFYR